MKTLVLLHGWGVRPAVFDPLRSLLSGRYDVRTPALPGYDGAAPCSPYDLANLAQRLAAEAPDRCSIVGWSLGGQVAATWAAGAPRQVERVALMATTPCFVQRATWQNAMHAAVLEAFAAALENDASRTLARFSLLQGKDDRQSRTVVGALRQALASPESADMNGLRGGLQILLHADLRDTVRAVAQDTLVMHGENDALVPCAAAQWLASSLPRGKLVVLPGAAHAPFLSDAPAAAHLLQEFFA